MRTYKILLLDHFPEPAQPGGKAVQTELKFEAVSAIDALTMARVYLEGYYAKQFRPTILGISDVTEK